MGSFPGFWEKVQKCRSFPENTGGLVSLHKANELVSAMSGTVDLPTAKNILFQS